jgi:hypothetical protein
MSNETPFPPCILNDSWSVLFVVANGMRARARRIVSQEGGIQTDKFPLGQFGDIIPSSSLLLAGLGAFGKAHLSRLTERSDVEVVGVADANPAAIEPIRARLGVAECLTDPLRLIEMVEADAIIVATPAVSHVEISVRALSRNLPMLLEKPVAPSAIFAVPLLAAAGQHYGLHHARPRAAVFAGPRSDG